MYYHNTYFNLELTLKHKKFRIKPFLPYKNRRPSKKIHNNLAIIKVLY